MTAANPLILPKIFAIIQTVNNYTAKVKVEREGLFAEDTAIINVSSSSGSPSVTFSVEKLVRNLSDGTSWAETVEADPLEVLSFSITVTNDGEPTQDVIIKDALPAGINYQEDLEIDGISYSGNIVSGINIGDLSSHQAKKITFKAAVAAAENFSFGTIELINTASANNSDFFSSDTAKIRVTRKQVAGATTIITGINFFVISLLITFFLALVFYFSISYLENSKNPLIRKILGIYYKLKSFILR